MNILLNGCYGFMGREVAKLCESGYRGATLVAGVDLQAKEGEANIYRRLSDVPATCKVDCIVDFSHHTCTEALMDFAGARGIPVVVATTGHTPEELACIHAGAKKTAVFRQRS